MKRLLRLSCCWSIALLGSIGLVSSAVSPGLAQSIRIRPIQRQSVQQDGFERRSTHPSIIERPSIQQPSRHIVRPSEPAEIVRPSLPQRSTQHLTIQQRPTQHITIERQPTVERYPAERYPTDLTQRRRPGSILPTLRIPQRYPDRRYPYPDDRYPYPDDRYDYRVYRRYRYVQPPDALPVSSSANCTALTVMARLAYITDPSSDLSQTVSGTQIAGCRGRDQAEQTLAQWENGRPIRFGNTFSYPNGQSAQFSDSWYYPNGRTLNQGSSWNYPNGRSARFGPYWYTPDGRTVSEQELISQACSVLDTRQCSDRLSAVRNAPEFWYNLTLIELSWRAYEDDQEW